MVYGNKFLNCSNNSEITLEADYRNMNMMITALNESTEIIHEGFFSVIGKIFSTIGHIIATIVRFIKEKIVKFFSIIFGFFKKIGESILKIKPKDKNSSSDSDSSSNSDSSNSNSSNENKNPVAEEFKSGQELQKVNDVLYDMNKSQSELENSRKALSDAKEDLENTKKEVAENITKSHQILDEQIKQFEKNMKESERLNKELEKQLSDTTKSNEEWRKKVASMPEEKRKKMLDTLDKAQKGQLSSSSNNKKTEPAKPKVPAGKTTVSTIIYSNEYQNAIDKYLVDMYRALKTTRMLSTCNEYKELFTKDKDGNDYYIPEERKEYKESVTKRRDKDIANFDNAVKNITTPVTKFINKNKSVADCFVKSEKKDFDIFNKEDAKKVSDMFKEASVTLKNDIDRVKNIESLLNWIKGTVERFGRSEFANPATIEEMNKRYPGYESFVEPLFKSAMNVYKSNIGICSGMISIIMYGIRRNVTVGMKFVIWAGTLNLAEKAAQ